MCIRDSSPSPSLPPSSSLARSRSLCVWAGFFSSVLTAHAANKAEVGEREWAAQVPCPITPPP
eukprot:853518-Rhodomonas_salina.1